MVDFGELDTNSNSLFQIDQDEMQAHCDNRIAEPNTQSDDDEDDDEQLHL